MIGRLSIHLRLTLWYGGVLAIVLVVFGAAVYAMMSHHLMARVDDGLREESADVLSEVERATEREEMLYWLRRRFAGHEGFEFQVTTAGGQWLFANPRLDMKAFSSSVHGHFCRAPNNGNRRVPLANRPLEKERTDEIQHAAVFRFRGGRPDDRWIGLLGVRPASRGNT